MHPTDSATPPTTGLSLSHRELELAQRWRLLTNAPYWEAPDLDPLDPRLELRIQALQRALDDPELQPRRDEHGRWQLFVDDLREVPYLQQWAPGHAHEGAVSTGLWTVARDRWEAQAIIAVHGLPDRISFDHDYGEPELTGDGSGLANWLSERHLDGLIDLRALKWQVHSSNPSGKHNIQSLLSSLRNVAPGGPSLGLEEGGG